MDPDEDKDLVEAVVTCEGNLHDPDFSQRFQTLVGNLKTLIYNKRAKEKFKVCKIEPWNSVRVTISLPKEAAQKLLVLAQNGSNALKSLGILSVQVEGDQVISLTMRGRNSNEPQEFVLSVQHPSDFSSSSSISSSCSSSSAAGSSDLGSQSPSQAPIPGPSSSSAVTTSMFKSSAISAFRSPNVVAPPGEVIPSPPTTKKGSFGHLPGSSSARSSNPTGDKSTPTFPFTSMTHAALASKQKVLDSTNSISNPVITSNVAATPSNSNSSAMISSAYPVTKAGNHGPIGSNVQQSLQLQLVNVPPHPSSPHSTQIKSGGSSVVNKFPPVSSNSGTAANHQQHGPSATITSVSNDSFSSFDNGQNRGAQQDMGAASSPLLVNLLQNNETNATSSASSSPQYPTTSASTILTEKKQSFKMKRGISVEEKSSNFSGGGGMTKTHSEPSSPFGSGSESQFSLPSPSIKSKPPESSSNVRLLPSQSKGLKSQTSSIVISNGPIVSSDMESASRLSLSVCQQPGVPVNPTSQTKTFAAPGSSNTASGKPRQFLINPLTGHLEPMTSNDDDASSKGSTKSNFSGLVVQQEEDKMKKTKTMKPIVVTSSGVTVARVVKQEHKDVDNSQDSQISMESCFNHDPRRILMMENMERKEKIKLKLKLEKKDPLYKADISVVKKPEVAEQPKESNTSPQSAQSVQPRVPPLHISLRGKNAAVVVSPKREDPSTTSSQVVNCSSNKATSSGVVVVKRTKSRIKSSDNSSNVVGLSSSGTIIKKESSSDLISGTSMTLTSATKKGKKRTQSGTDKVVSGGEPSAKIIKMMPLSTTTTSQVRDICSTPTVAKSSVSTDSSGSVKSIVFASGIDATIASVSKSGVDEGSTESKPKNVTCTGVVIANQASSSSLGAQPVDASIAAKTDFQVQPPSEKSSIPDASEKTSISSIPPKDSEEINFSIPEKSVLSDSPVPVVSSVAVSSNPLLNRLLDGRIDSPAPVSSQCSCSNDAVCHYCAKTDEVKAKPVSTTPLNDLQGKRDEEPMSSNETFSLKEKSSIDNNQPMKRVTDEKVQTPTSEINVAPKSLHVAHVPEDEEISKCNVSSLKTPVESQNNSKADSEQIITARKSLPEKPTEVKGDNSSLRDNSNSESVKSAVAITSSQKLQTTSTNSETVISAAVLTTSASTTVIAPLLPLPLVLTKSEELGSSAQPGEDSGIDSMDALSEKSPNQGESPIRKDSELSSHYERSHTTCTPIPSTDSIVKSIEDDSIKSKTMSMSDSTLSNSAKSEQKDSISADKCETKVDSNEVEITEFTEIKTAPMNTSTKENLSVTEETHSKELPKSTVQVSTAEVVEYGVCQQSKETTTSKKNEGVEPKLKSIDEVKKTSVETKDISTLNGPTSDHSSSSKKHIVVSDATSEIHNVVIPSVPQSTDAVFAVKSLPPVEGKTKVPTKESLTGANKNSEKLLPPSESSIEKSKKEHPANSSVPCTPVDEKLSKKDTQTPSQGEPSSKNIISPKICVSTSASSSSSESSQAEKITVSQSVAPIACSTVTVSASSNLPIPSSSVSTKSEQPTASKEWINSKSIADPPVPQLDLKDSDKSNIKEDKKVDPTVSKCEEENPATKSEPTPTADNSETTECQASEKDSITTEDKSKTTAPCPIQKKKATKLEEIVAQIGLNNRSKQQSQTTDVSETAPVISQAVLKISPSTGIPVSSIVSSGITVLAGGHKVVPIKVLTMPSGSGSPSQQQLLEAVNMVSSRSGSPIMHAKIHSSGISGGVHLVPISMVSSSGTGNPMKVLVSSPVKMMMGGNQTIRVVRPVMSSSQGTLSQPSPLTVTSEGATENAQSSNTSVKETSPQKPTEEDAKSSTPPPILPISSVPAAGPVIGKQEQTEDSSANKDSNNGQQQELFENLEGVELLQDETEEDLAFEADIIHDEKDLADVLASETPPPPILENGLDDRVDHGGSSSDDLPMPTIRSVSPRYTYSSSSHNHRRSSINQSPDADDQEVIDSFSSSPVRPKLSPQVVVTSSTPSQSIVSDHCYSNATEELSIEIPPVETPSTNKRNTRSNTRLVSPDITAFRSETPKLQKFTGKPDPGVLKNSPKPSPTGSLKLSSPCVSVSGGCSSGNTSARSSPVMEKEKSSGTSNKKGISGKRKRQGSESSTASKDEMTDDTGNNGKVDPDVNSRPGKRRCSENAAELIKACIGAEDTPKKNVSLLKKVEENNYGNNGSGSNAKGKHGKANKPMSTLIEEDELESIEMALSRGVCGRSSRGSSEDRSSSRGSSVHRTSIGLKDDDHTKEPTRATKASVSKKEKGKMVSRVKNASSNVKDGTSSEPSKTSGRRSNRSGHPTSTTASKRKKDGTVDKSVSTPTTSPENENPRRKTRSSAAGNGK